MSTQLSYPDYSHVSDAQNLRSKLDSYRWDPPNRNDNPFICLHEIAIFERLEELGDLSIRERIDLRIYKGEYKIL